jgi:hypothetical protein
VGVRDKVMIGMGLALALAATTFNCRRDAPRRPGESADAAAAGSGYGVGRPTGEIKGEKDHTGTGPSATGNPDEHAMRRDGAADPAGGVGGAIGRAVNRHAVKGK